MTIENNENMNNGYFWQGEKIKLRPVKYEDWQMQFEEDNDSEGLRALEPGIELPKNEEIRKDRIEKIINNKSENTLWFSIENMNGEYVGSTNIHNRDERNGTFSIMVRIFRSYRGRGYADEALKIVLRYGFHELRYQKVNSETVDFNTASINLHKSLGFKEEGRRRRCVFTGGKYYDEVLFGMTREEFDDIEIKDRRQ